MPYSEQQLRDAVDAVFTAYDKDNSGTLDVSEVTSLINDALKHMNAGRQATQQEVSNLITQIDKNSDGKVNKVELLQIFQKVCNN